MQKVIVAGGRNFNNYPLLKRVLNNLFHEDIIIVSGCANGADALGIQYAKERNFVIEYHPADWKNLNAEPCSVKYNAYGAYNALAGHNRNREMLDSVLANPDGGCLVAFWDGKSTGTRNMINISQEAGLQVHIINY